MHPTDTNGRDSRIDGPIGDAYAQYDSDPRVNGPDGFEAFADAVESLVSELEASRARIANAAMAGAECIEVIPDFNGVKQVAAYQKFERIWMTTLSAEDMTYMRGVVGLSEPSKDGETQ